MTDPLTGLNQTISLQPGADRIFNTSHTITQNDINAGRFDNTATARYTYAGTTYSETDNATVYGDQSPALTIAKNALQSSYTSVNDIIRYDIIVTNTGNVTLTNILVTDPLTGFSQTIASLAPGASRTLNTSHRITQNDLNSGHFDNTATCKIHILMALHTQCQTTKVYPPTRLLKLP